LPSALYDVREPPFGAVPGTLGDRHIGRAEPADMALLRISPLRRPD